MAVLALGLGTLATGGSITITNGVITLVNDSVSPGNDYVYATTSGGVKAWRQLSAFGATSVAGTAGNVLVNGGTAAATGAIVLSLPTALTSINSITAATTTDLTLSGGSSGASLVLGQGTNGSTTLNALGTGRLNFGVAGTNYGSAASTGFYFSNSGGAQNVTPAAAIHAYSGSASVGSTQITAEGVFGGYGAGLSLGSRTSNGGTLVEMARVVADGASAWNTTGATQIANLSFWTTNAGTPTKAATLTYSGNLLIGTTTDISGSAGMRVAGTTAATSTTTGSLQNAGGFGNAGAGYFGDFVYATKSTLNQNPMGFRAYNTNTTGYSAFQAYNAAGYTDAVSTSFGLGGTTEGTSFQNYGYVYTGTSTNGFRVFTNGATLAATFNNSQGLVVAGTTAATNTTSGAVQIGSNIGLSGNSGGPSYFGGSLDVAGATVTIPNGSYYRAKRADGNAINVLGFDSATNNLVTVLAAGGYFIKDTGATTLLSVSNAGVVNVPNTTSATTSLLGALVVGNGSAATSVGIGGGNIVAGGNITASGLAATSNLTLSAGSNPRIYWNAGQTAWIDYTGTTWTFRNSSGNTRLTVADAGTDISATTSASSSTVGALTIGNGTASTNVAIGGGNINAGGTLTVGGAAAFAGAVTGASSISAATGGFQSDNSSAYPGALAATGLRMYSNAVTGLTMYGRGTASDVLVANRSGQTVFEVPATTQNISFASTTASTSTSTGSATFAGGVGIAGTVWALNMAVTSSTTSYSATTDLDFTGASGLTTISLTGNLTLTSSGRAAGRGKVIRLISDGSTRNLTFPAGWTFIGGSAPTSISANRTGILSVTFFGTADTDAICAWSVQP